MLTDQEFQVLLANKYKFILTNRRGFLFSSEIFPGLENYARFDCETLISSGLLTPEQFSHFNLPPTIKPRNFFWWIQNWFYRLFRLLFNKIYRW